MLGFVSLIGCSYNSSRISPAVNQLLSIYHSSEPQDDLFVMDNEAIYLGSPARWKIVYYEYIWGEDIKDIESYRSTQYLLVFDNVNHYIGKYMLDSPIKANSTVLVNDIMTITFINGNKSNIDFTNDLPMHWPNQGDLFEPRQIRTR